MQLATKDPFNPTTQISSTLPNMSSNFLYLISPNLTNYMSSNFLFWVKKKLLYVKQFLLNPKCQITMSRNSLLPFTSTRCTASATVSSLSDPHDASGFQKAACGKKGKKYQVEYPCQLLPRVLQAHYQSPRSRLPEFKMVNISVQKASPFTSLQHPLSSE